MRKREEMRLRKRGNEEENRRKDDIVNKSWDKGKGRGEKKREKEKRLASRTYRLYVLHDEVGLSRDIPPSNRYGHADEVT